MLTTTKHFILFNLIALAAITCSYVGFHPQPKPTLTAVSTTAPAPSDGLLISKGDDAKWVDATMIPSNKCRVGWNCGIKAGEFVPVSRWTLAQEMEFSESRRPRKQAKTEDPCPPRSWSGAVYQSSGASNSPNIIGGCGSVTIINGEQK